MSFETRRRHQYDHLRNKIFQIRNFYRCDSIWKFRFSFNECSNQSKKFFNFHICKNRIFRIFKSFSHSTIDFVHFHFISRIWNTRMLILKMIRLMIQMKTSTKIYNSSIRKAFIFDFLAIYDIISVMRNVWIDWFRNYERQNVNLCIVTANQLSDHHSFSMKWRQDSCQKSCQNIWSKFISSNLILCHNNLSIKKKKINVLIEFHVLSSCVIISCINLFFSRFSFVVAIIRILRMIEFVLFNEILKIL